MADRSKVAVPPPFDIPDWLKNSRDGEYLSKIDEFVFQKQYKCFVLKRRSGSSVNLRIAWLKNTSYRDRVEEVNECGEFYVPQVVNMRVLGVVEGTPCPCDELVLMTCEDKKVYAYDGEELHEVASDLNELREEGLEYPASKTYCNGEAFKDLTDDDWQEVRKSAVGQKLEEEHQKLVMANKSKFLESLH